MVESKEDTVIKKYLEANEKIKGAKIKEKVTADTNEGSESKNVKMDMDVSYYADPFGSKADVATTVGSSVQHSTVLSDGKDMYLQLAIVYARGKHIGARCMAKSDITSLQRMRQIPRRNF